MQLSTSPETSRRGFFRNLVGLGSPAARPAVPVAVAPVATEAPAPVFQRRNVRPSSIPDVRSLDD